MSCATCGRRGRRSGTEADFPGNPSARRCILILRFPLKHDSALCGQDDGHGEQSSSLCTDGSRAVAPAEKPEPPPVFSSSQAHLDQALVFICGNRDAAMSGYRYSGEQQTVEPGCRSSLPIQSTLRCAASSRRSSCNASEAGVTTSRCTEAVRLGRCESLGADFSFRREAASSSHCSGSQDLQALPLIYVLTRACAAGCRAP